jgi:hypothetical protein
MSYFVVNGFALALLGGAILASLNGLKGPETTTAANAPQASSGHCSASCLVAAGPLEGSPEMEANLDRLPLVALTQACYTTHHRN